MKRSILIWCCLILLLALAGACRRKSRYFIFSEGESVPSEVAPRVVGFSPERSTHGLPLSTVITARFDRPIDTATVTRDSFTVSTVGGPIEGSFDFEDVPSLPGTDVTFRPALPLGLYSEYTVDIDRDVRDTSGNRLAAQVVWSFRTRDGVFEGDESLDPSVNFDSRPALAFDDRGGATAVWNGFEGTQSQIFVRRLEPDGTWKMPEPISFETDGSVSFPSLEVMSSGSELALWQRQATDGTRQIMSSSYDPTDGWTSPEAIDGDGEDEPRSPTIAATPDGRAQAVWISRDPVTSLDQLRASSFDPGSSWGTTTVVRAGVTVSGGPVMASNEAGDVVVLWTETADDETDLWGAVFSRGEGWRAPRLLDLGSEPPSIPDFAIDDAGRATVIWSQRDGQLSSIWWNRWEESTGWREASRFEEPDVDANQPRLALSDDGELLAVWQALQAPPAPLGQVRARRYRTGSGWGEIEVAAEEAGHALHSPRLGLDAAGGAVVIFQLVSRQGWDDVLAVRFDPERGWGAIQPLEHTNEDTRDVRIRVDGRGNAVGLWQRRTNGIWRIWANRLLGDGGWLGEERLGGQSRRIVLDMNPSGLVGVVWIGPGQQGLSAQIRTLLFR